jgi:hypothetical protein
MSAEQEQPVRTRELIMTTPLTVAGKVLQPVARLDGWWQASEWGGGALARLSPHSVKVEDGDRTYTVSLSDPAGADLKTFFYVGGAVAVGCIVFMLLVRLATGRR